MIAARLQTVNEGGADAAPADLLFVDPSALAVVDYKEIFGPLGADEADEIDISLLLAGLGVSPQASGHQPVHTDDPSASSHLYAPSTFQLVFDDMNTPDTGSHF